MQPFSKELGYFWLPDRPDAARSGNLTFGHEDSGITLTILNPFEDFQTFAPLITAHPGYKVIFGVLESGSPVTLTSVEVGRTTVAFRGTGTIPLDLHPHFIFRGAHLPDGEETALSEIQLRFEHIDEWAAPDQPIVTETRPDGSIVLTRDLPDGPSGSAFGGTLKIAYLSMQHNRLNTLTYERSAQIEFTPDQQSNIGQLLSSFAIPMQRFMTFACGVPTHLLSLSVNVEGLGRQVGSKWLAQKIEVGYVGWRSPSGAKSPTQMRLPLATIRDRLGAVLQAWDVLHTQQEHSMSLLFAISLGIGLYLDSRFLFAAQALELFHRKEWPDGVLPEEEHKARVASIVDDVEDETLRPWLKEKLNFSNEPTLKQRLRQMLDFVGDEILPLLRDDFVKVTGDTRNYLTHFNPNLESKAASGQELWLLSYECIALLEMCLLRKLGFTGVEALQHSSTTPTFQLLLQNRTGASPVVVTVTPGPPPEQQTRVEPEESEVEPEESPGDAGKAQAGESSEATETEPASPSEDHRAEPLHPEPEEPEADFDQQEDV